MHIYTNICFLAWISVALAQHKASAVRAAAAAATATQVPFVPNKIDAEKNAHAIFNSVHSAGRQWGSGIYHNGFALIPAVVPRGSIFYHGTETKDVPSGPEWLAFDAETAEAFAADWFGAGTGGSSSLGPSVTAQSATSPPSVRGYVHTYRNKRDLKLLYVDGMSAGKTNYGTLDTQDLVLLEGMELDKTQFEDLSRAQELCKVVQPWGYDGLIRTEMGIEIINCDFTATLTQMKVKGTFFGKERLGDNSMHMYQWVRAVGQRYDGLGARLKLDFSSMVSGLFYPINTTNPDPQHPEFKRLAATPMDNLRVIKNRVEEIAKANFQTFLIDWRYIVDTIVERFSDRLAAMADKDVDDMEFINELETAATSYIDAPSLEDDAKEPIDQDSLIKQSIKDCIDHYLYPALPFSLRWNQADHMLYHSVTTVMNDICTTFIQAWFDLHDVNDKKQHRTLIDTKERVKELTDRLGWTTWRKIRPCPVDETILVAMWPYGDKEDHSNPGCRNRGQLRWNRTGYWELDWPEASGQQPSDFDSEEL